MCACRWLASGLCVGWLLTGRSRCRALHLQILHNLHRGSCSKCAFRWGVLLYACIFTSEKWATRQQQCTEAWNQLNFGASSQSHGEEEGMHCFFWSEFWIWIVQVVWFIALLCLSAWVSGKHMASFSYRGTVQQWEWLLNLKQSN